MIGNLLTQDFRIYNHLAGLALKGKTPHALLFHGRPGSAKLLLALKLSQFIVCNNKKGTEACGVCPACIKASRMIHPDIHYVFPVVKKDGKKRMDTVSNDFLPEWRSIILSNPYVSIQDWMNALNADNSQPNINTKECNEIIHKLNLQSYESDSKILVIWLPEFLGKEGNRLLKLIEEPTDNTFIFLVADDTTRILGTILSRTQLVSVPPVRDEEMIQLLTEAYHLDATQANQIASLADGNLGSAIRMIDMASQNYSGMLFQWIRLSYKSNPQDLTSWINTVATIGREGQKNFLQYGLSFFREYLFLSQTNKRGPRLTDEEYETALKMQSIIDMEKCCKIVELLDENIRNISRNAHPKITFMAMSMQIGALLKGEVLSPKNI